MRKNRDEQPASSTVNDLIFQSIRGVILILITLTVLAWSGWQPKDRFTWFLETVPVMAGLCIVLLLRKRFPLTPMLQVGLTIHGIILMVGGKYNYAEVPIGFWLRDVLELSRNPWDRIGHLAQGFFPALLAREVLLRNQVFARRGWLFLCVTALCLGFSALYELLEWAVALSTGEDAQDFLGTQGDVWDTQWDMFLALVGCLVAQLALGKWHTRAINKITVRTPNTEAGLRAKGGICFPAGRRRP